MARDKKLLHIIRHAEGLHQLAHDHPDASVRDAPLTPHGIEQARKIGRRFPFHSEIDLLCASPLRRTIQTAKVAFSTELERGMKILALAQAQEMSDAPSDTGSNVHQLIAELGDILDVSLLSENWYKKTGINCPRYETLRQRTTQLRCFLHKRPESNIVLVCHGAIAQYITGQVDSKGHQTGKRTGISLLVEYYL